MEVSGMKDKYGKTLIACYLGFITQAIAANFAPLLFLTFKRTYGIPISEIAFISTTFFFTQLLIDLFCAKYPRAGADAPGEAAHVLGIGDKGHGRGAP